MEGILASAGLELDASSNRALAASLAAVAEAAPESAPLVRALATRAMSEAQYFCTGAGENCLSNAFPLAALVQDPLETRRWWFRGSRCTARASTHCEPTGVHA